jgi:hypothetical protein
MPGTNSKTSKKPSRRWWYLLFAVQFPGLLAVPFYNTTKPEWQGIPFFYWYQFLWIIVGAILTATVYFATVHNKS